MRTTKAHFTLYKREVAHWISRLGLTDFHVDFRHKAQSEESVRATVTYGLTGRTVTFWLSPVWEVDVPTSAQIKRTALHEVLHLLLADLTGLIHAREYDSDGRATPLEHAVLRRLENAILGRA